MTETGSYLLTGFQNKMVTVSLAQQKKKKRSNNLLHRCSQRLDLILRNDLSFMVDDFEYKFKFKGEVSQNVTF